MSTNYRALRPNNSHDAAVSTDSLSDDPQSPTDAGNAQITKRSQVPVACQICRKHKAKCDGKQPCKRCIARRFTCEFDSRPDETRGGALRRRIDSLQIAQSQLQELFAFLHTRPESEAYEIFRRIRASTDPFEVLHLVKHGDLLLQQPISNGGDTQDSPRLLRLDLEALQASPFKVHARPWTVVAGDGLVSELISTFLMWDQPFYFSFIDRDSFLTDLELSDVDRARYCSPMLVNAMCALRCHTSDRAKFSGLAQDKDMRERFFSEAKRLFDLEFGRPSLPTVQALLIMYVCSAGLGRDRAGTIYRYTAYEMLKRLHLEKKFSTLKDPGQRNSTETQRRVISRALWGIYCFESISAFTYLQPSLVQRPTIPRQFGDVEPDRVVVTDIHGEEFTSGSSQPPVISGVLNAMCDLSDLLFETMTYVSDTELRLGSAEDIEKRKSLYQKVLEWRYRLPAALTAERYFLPQTYYLSSYEDMIVLAIFRPLNPDTRLMYEPGTAGGQCIARCERSLSGLEAYTSMWPTKDYSVMAIYPLYNCSITLVAHLDDPRTHDLFGRTCHMLLQRAHDFPFTMYLLQGLKVIAGEHRTPIPAAAAPYFRDLRFRKEDLRDVPISFVLPKRLEMVTMLSRDDLDSAIGAQLGTLISRYSAMSMDG